MNLTGGLFRLSSVGSGLCESLEYHLESWELTVIKAKFSRRNLMETILQWLMTKKTIYNKEGYLQVAKMKNFQQTLTRS